MSVALIFTVQSRRQYFEDGKGRDIDLIQALFWYRKAAAQEDQEAMVAVERLA